MRRRLFGIVFFAFGMMHQIGLSQVIPPAPEIDPDSPLTLESLNEKIVRMQNDFAAQLGELQALRASHSNSILTTVLGDDVPSEQFMPPPADPGNLFFNETNRADVNLGAGSRVAGTDLIFRAALTGNVQMWYDTGLVGSGSQFNPSTIASGGSSAQGAGVFDMVNFNGQLKFDLNVPISPDEQAQAYLETNYFNGDLRVRHAFGRANFRTVNVLAGSYWTTWGDEGAIPKSINSINGFPAGANTVASVPQLRLAFPTENGWVTSVAIQQPQPAGNIALTAASDKVLQRYPDLAARIRYFDGDFFSFSVGGIVHALGRENVAGTENFATGWGVSATTRFRTSQCGALMLGTVGGKGVAGSIFGLSDTLAAGTSGGNLVALNNYGAYAGYQHEWTEYMLSTVAYGIAQGDGTLAGTTHKSQNSWMNLIYKANDNFAFAVQYEYGDRAIVDNNSGDNHRISLVVSVTTGQKEKSNGDAAVRAMPQADAVVRENIRSNVPRDSGASRFPRL